MEAYEGFIREKVEKERWTHQRVGSYLQQVNPAERGFSLRTVERFCTEKGISKLTPIPDDHLDRVVATSISNVGPTYGRKMMKGMLASHGIQVAEKRLASSMQRMNPSHHLPQRVKPTPNPTMQITLAINSMLTKMRHWQCSALHKLLLLMGTVQKLLDL